MTNRKRDGETPSRKCAGSVIPAVLLFIILLLLGAICAVLLLRRSPAPEEEAEKEETEKPVIEYRGFYLPVLEDILSNHYAPSVYQWDENGYLHYLRAPMGIDVSSFQGKIDWEQVALAGVRFAMIRAGYRGYTQGGLRQDERFEENLTGAAEAGIEVGVYFFSQAVNASEAREEAEYVLELIGERSLTYPVAFDWEPVGEGIQGRADGLTPEETALCASAFCAVIEEAGYSSAVYFNTDQAYFAYELEHLPDTVFWLADYSGHPSFYYHYELLQYSEEGQIPGIEGPVDLNLDLRFARKRTGPR